MPSEIKVQLRQTALSTSEASIRGHRVLLDRPPAKGGADLGPMGGELFLAAIGGCFMSTLLAAIKARESAITDIHAEITGVLLDAPARFGSVELLVTAESADRAQLEKLVEIADRGCIMMNTLRDKLEVSVRIGAPV